MSISQKLKEFSTLDFSAMNDFEIYTAIIKLINSITVEKSKNKQKKKLYYISAEFLIGRLLSCNLINLGIYDEVRKILLENGKSLEKAEELEPEPSLGNGGLGRLAACFLDSIACLGLNGDGIGLNYHFGLFKQVFKDNMQTEEPNPWINNSGFIKRQNFSNSVKFKDFTLNSVLYDIDVIGNNNTTNTLHLFDCDTIDENIINSGISYNKADIKKNLTLFLYPDDSDKAGQYLRIYQQYFMVSNAAKLIIDECMCKGSNLYNIHEYAVIQINDTHPTLIIPELIRILCEKGIDFDSAVYTVSKTCAYTNHTILAESLEKWHISFLKDTVPHLVPIIEILDNRVRRKYSDPSVYIIDKEDRVCMAHIDIHCGFSINGVAELHTEILKNTELNNFYNLYPEKFNNKTNGITFRRWLLRCNPLLTDFITSLIGDDFKTDEENLKQLLNYKNDSTVLSRLLEIKKQNKLKLKQYLLSETNTAIDENSIFDIQIKRLHEYKRQQLNVLYLIHKYLSIKDGEIPKRPVTAIFGAKAAPAYTIAKDIIHLILCLKEIINSDPEASKYLKIVMIENYNVTKAELLIPACDISEQISLASKEASGTGNMKLMLNGAVTLGTEDGANVEIHELVGDENIYIFGDDSKTVIERYKNNSYNASEYYNNNKKIQRAVDFITCDEMLKTGNKESLERLKNELINKDWFMTFPDFEEYVTVKEKAFSDYENRELWAKKMLVNIANSGYFSSDRTIREYNRDIWKLDGGE